MERLVGGELCANSVLTPANGAEGGRGGRAAGARCGGEVRGAAADYEGGRSSVCSGPSAGRPFTTQRRREGKRTGGEDVVVRRCGEVL
jgi:hypothetical protein